MSMLRYLFHLSILCTIEAGIMISKENRKKTLLAFFKDGCHVVKKEHRNHFVEQHHELEDVPNLHVRMIMKSLTSKGWAKETFAWQSYYYTITEEGVLRLREMLYLDPEAVPETWKRRQRGTGGPGGGPGGRRPPRRYDGPGGEGGPGGPGSFGGPGEEPIAGRADAGAWGKSPVTADASVEASIGAPAPAPALSALGPHDYAMPSFLTLTFSALALIGLKKYGSANHAWRPQKPLMQA
eukprot:gnl/MRDRNA2_/MRDRNA2_99627_c0_seq1.p1 gnl/MRDRNA2_/MRDRNA2_99627_c0~~gnl/MRDRNA2_/MRDRNA2_99627_c0_seq1.p1  ORF type:complete len:239 (+),score=31.75 gnl/MRDRNA2_/MRDRNA2_99627_c0_seq1:109-825(+)